MKYSVQNIIPILFISFPFTIMSHGFGQQTLIHLDNNSAKNIHSICLDALRQKISVASHNISNSHPINKFITKVKQSTANCYIKLGFDFQESDDILCTPVQEFYLPTLSKWIPAYMLKPGDALLTKNMTIKYLKHKKIVPSPLKIYMLEIDGSHTFFVGKHGILTHNIFLPAAAYLGFTVPFGSVAAGTAGSFLGPIGVVGGIIIGGIASIAIKAIYEHHIQSYKTPKYNISFIQNYCNSSQQTNTSTSPGCFNDNASKEGISTHIIPVEYPSVSIPTGCIEIEVCSPNSQVTYCYDIFENQETNPQGCFQPIEKNEEIILNKQEKTSESEKPRTRYQGEKARNWDEFEKNCHMGQKYGKKFIPTGKRNSRDGSPIRKLSEDIPNTELFKKDHYYALDRFHEGDHFEVWDRRGNWIGVANLDGSKNHKKTNAVTDTSNRNLPR